MDNEKLNSKSINNTTVTDAGLSSSAPPSSISPLPTMTSILADSSHLDTSSDAGDIDQPLMIGELESLLDGEVFENNEGPLPSKSQPSSKESRRPPPLKPKPHVRKTDSATGQEEDQTPASSPKTGPDTVSKHLQSFGEQRNKSTLNSNTSTSFAMQVPPPPLSSPSPHHQVGPVSLLPTASTQSEAVGYGQPQQTPLPEYKTHNSSSLTTNAPQGSKNAAGPSPSSSSLANNLNNDDNDDDIFSASLPILEKSKTVLSQVSTTVGQHSGAVGATRAGGTHQQHGGGHPSISLAQSALTLCMKSPLPLPQWLVAAMTRVQSKHEHCAASGAGLSKKKRGSGEWTVCVCVCV